MKRKWIIISVVAAVLVLLIAGGTVVYAQSQSTPTPTTTPTTTPKDTLMAKVAAILGIDHSKLESAFNQAEKEMQAEALQKRLDALVEAGKLTQQQADEYKAWWNSRPTDAPGVICPNPRLGAAGRGPSGLAGEGYKNNRAPATTT